MKIKLSRMSTRTSIMRLFPGILAVCFALPVAAEVHKCMDDKGGVVYSDHECSLGKEALPLAGVQESSKANSGVHSARDAVDAAYAIMDLNGSQESIQKLIEMLGDERHKVGASFIQGALPEEATLGRIAAIKLVRIGNSAVKPLIEALEKSRGHARRNAIYALADLDAPDAASLIADALSDSDPETRETAARALRKFQVKRADLVPVLIKNVRTHPDMRNHGIAFAALDYLGFLNDPDARRFLRQMSRSTDDRMTHNAKAALETYGQGDDGK